LKSKNVNKQWHYGKDEIECFDSFFSKFFKGSSCSLSYGSWIYNYLCNQCLSPLKWVWIPLRSGVLDTTYDKVFQW